MTTLIVKDLETSKELTRKELSGVRGGFNFANVGGQSLLMGGANIFSPTVAFNTPIVTQTEVNPVVNVDINLANIIGSMNTGIGQVA